MPLCPCWPPPWPMATLWSWCPAGPVPSLPWMSARYSQSPAFLPACSCSQQPFGQHRDAKCPRAYVKLGFHPGPSVTMVTPVPASKPSLLDPATLFCIPQAFTSHDPSPIPARSPVVTQSPTPTALEGLRLLPSQPRVAHSLCPLGHDYLVAGGPGERGDRGPGPPDPLPGLAPGRPGPVVFRFRPGTLPSATFCAFNSTNRLFLFWEHGSAPLKLPLLRGKAFWLPGSEVVPQLLRKRMFLAART